MATVQTLQAGLVDPRHYGTNLYKPAQWLQKEISVITDPSLEIIGKMTRLVLIVILPFALALAAAGGFYNLGAHLISPLEPIPEKPPHQDLINKVQQLNTDCEHVFDQQGLSGLRGEKGAALLKRFVDLRKEIEPHKENDHVITWFVLFETLEKQYIAAIRQRVSLIQAPIRMEDSGHIPIHDRGNCFFEAASTAYELYNQYKLQASQMDESVYSYRLDPVQLRKTIIDWEETHYTNDLVLKGYIDAAIDIFVADKQKEIYQREDTITLISLERSTVDPSAIRQEIVVLKSEIDPYLASSTRFDHYFEKAAEDKFWASLAEFYAFAQLYKVRILVREENQGIEKPLDRCMRFNETAPNSMTIWWIDGHHFEVRMEKH